MKKEQEENELLTGRPKREKRINKDDLLNVKILVNQKLDVTDFIKKI